LDEFLIRGKRKRLDHLTWEEKLQRKKLKNRVAAQTSRDRKKAKMEEMESTIQLLTDQNETLKGRCDSLQVQNDKLLTHNKELEKRLEDLERRFELSSCKIKKTSDVGCETITEGSAVSNINPLLKGMVPQSTPQDVLKKNNESTNSIWKIIALCLLYKTCSAISTCPDLKNLPKVYWKMSPQNWKTIIQEAARHLPKMKASQAECLNEWWGPQQSSWNPAKISIEV
jgi:X box-binding protein 1